MCEVGFGASGQPPARFLTAARTAGGVDLGLRRVMEDLDFGLGCSIQNGAFSRVNW